MPRMAKTVPNYLLYFLMISVALLSGCNSNDSDNGNGNDSDQALAPELVTVDGYVVKGPVKNSLVSIYEVLSNGERGGLIAGPFITDDDGYWQGSVPNIAGVYEVLSLGGSYIDEASNDEVRRDASERKDSLSGILDARTSTTVVVTPYTSAAIFAAKHDIAINGTDASSAMRQAIFDISAAIGFDIGSTIPATYSEDVVSTGSDEENYAALLGGFSQLLHNNPSLSSVNNTSAHVLRNAMIQDVADGRLDGKDANDDDINVTLLDDTVVTFPALDANSIDVLVNAANNYAITQVHLENVSLPSDIEFEFGLHHHRLLNYNFPISVDGNGVFVLEDEGVQLYSQRLRLGLSEGPASFHCFTHFIEYDNFPASYVRLMGFEADVDNNITGATGSVCYHDDDNLNIETLEITPLGVVSMQDDMDNEVVLGQIVLAMFANLDGLRDLGGGGLADTEDSGAPVIGAPGSGGLGRLRFDNHGSSINSNYALSANGEMFFVLEQEGNRYYAKSGQFYFDKNGFLTTGDYQLVTFLADDGGDITGEVDVVQRSITNLNPSATTSVDLDINLDATDDVPLVPVTSSTITFSGPLSLDTDDTEYTTPVFNNALVDNYGYAYINASIRWAHTGATTAVPQWQAELLIGGVPTVPATTATVADVSEGGTLTLDWDPDGSGAQANIALTADLTGFSHVDAGGGGTTAMRADVDGAAQGDFSSNNSSSYNHSTSHTIYDSLGQEHTVTIYFRKTAAPNAWEMYSYVDDEEISGPDYISFTTTGELITITPTAPATQLNASLLTTPIFIPTGNNAMPASMQLTFNLRNLMLLDYPFSVISISQDGRSTGRWLATHISTDGKIVNVYNDGVERAIGQILVAKFDNASALSQLGDGIYAQTVNSGTPLVNVPGSGGAPFINLHE